MNPSYIPSPLDANLAMDVANTVAATGAGTVKDLGANFAPPNAGMPVLVVVQPTANVGTGTYTAVVQECATADGSFTDAGPVVTITPGSTSAISLPAFISMEFVQVLYTLGGTDPSLIVNSWLAPYGAAIN